MFTKDSQDILGASQQVGSGKRNSSGKTPEARKIIKKVDSGKKPGGMHRELYNLLQNQGKDDNIQSLVPSNTKLGYTNAKIQFGRKKVRHWVWRPFSNPGRKDGFMLSHWEREGENPDKVYPFAKFNQHTPIPMFTDVEYEEYLQDNRWTKDESMHLLELCERFDLRWPVIDDRFDRKKFNAKKDLVDLKERYYNITNQLKVARNSNEQPFEYHAEHEKRRKEQLEKLLNRTDEQIKEEEELKLALKRIEIKRKEREKKATELQRIINATERTSLSPDSTSAGGSIHGGQRGQRRGASRSTQAAAAQLFTPAETSTIRYHDFRAPGPHLRSQEMKLPTNIGQKKAKNIETVAEKLKIDPILHAFEDVVNLYNDFRSNVVRLQELKSALQATEGELDLLSQRMKEEKDVVLNIDPKMRMGSAMPEATEAHGKAKYVSKVAGEPSTSRRITSWVDASGGLSTSRKRKARQLSPQDPENARTH
ncbi:DNA methyltransferase 1-associated protein 1 (DMAP1) domain-containing protein [Ditylenchus destructor]|nr:DNA methyltransferase 1-associated protein 1 (DMAP1) domain-containing protein [Ditylenchus destructor]